LRRRYGMHRGDEHSPGCRGGMSHLLLLALLGWSHVLIVEGELQEAQGCQNQRHNARAEQSMQGMLIFTGKRSTHGQMAWARAWQPVVAYMAVCCGHSVLPGPAGSHSCCHSTLICKTAADRNYTGKHASGIIPGTRLLPCCCSCASKTAAAQLALAAKRA
jgi:hypothetical protein